MTNIGNILRGCGSRYTIMSSESRLSGIPQSQTFPKFDPNGNAPAVLRAVPNREVGIAPLAM
jgi:hypothetical protein